MTSSNLKWRGYCHSLGKMHLLLPQPSSSRHELGGAGSCRVVPDMRELVPDMPGDAGWCRVVPSGAGWCRVVPGAGAAAG